MCYSRKRICAAVCIVDDERTVRSGREHADAPAILEALEYNALHGFTRILVDLGDGNVLLHHIGNSEESRILAVVFDGEYRFIQAHTAGL